MERNDRLKAIDARIAALAETDPDLMDSAWRWYSLDGTQKPVLVTPKVGRGEIFCIAYGRERHIAEARANFLAAALDDVRFLRAEIGRLNAQETQVGTK